MSQGLLRRFWPFLLCATASSEALAQTQVLVDRARLRLADLVVDVPARLREVDLGAAPPPGTSRLIARSEIENELRVLGENSKDLKLPTLVRVVRQAKRWSADELRDWFRPALEQALPNGVRLVQIKLSRGIVTPPRVELGKVVLPRLPRRVGSATVTGTVEVLDQGEVFLRVPANLALDISAQGATPTLSRGERVSLVIERGPTRVSATAVAMQNLELGETGSFRVLRTQRVLRARLESRAFARLVEQ